MPLTRAAVPAAMSLLLVPSQARADEDYRTPIPKESIQHATDLTSLDKFADMRLGMMVHWGPCVLTGGEISWDMANRAKYEASVPKFDPKHFNADAWTAIAGEMGARYFTLVTKHHDGFCLWDTRTTDFNIMNSPMKVDVVGAVAESCGKSGLVFGAYHSIMDIHESKWDRCYGAGNAMPGFPEQIPHITELTKRQTLELIDRYHPAILWYDGQWLQGWDAGSAKVIYDAIKAKSPGCVVRLERQGGNDADYHCMEANIGTYREAPWEVVTSVSYPTYSYHPPGNHFRPAAVWIEKLSQIVTGNGNMLLNFLPDENGVINDVQKDIARNIGAWMKVNGEAVYATRGGPWFNGSWGGSTRKNKDIYIHLTTNAPESLTLPPCGRKLLSSASISAGEATAKQNPDGSILITSPKSGRASVISVLKLSMDGLVKGMIPEKVRDSEPPASRSEEIKPAEERSPAQ